MAVGAAIAGAAAGLGGSLFNTIYSIYRNGELDRREDTAIQRRVEDLRKAGLNPLLAASGNGAGASQGLSTSLDTSGFNNLSQVAFDIKNQRESYKQNQLATKMMEAQLADTRLNNVLNNLQFNALIGNTFGGMKVAKYDRFGNLKQTPAYLSGGDNQNLLQDIANSPYFKTLQNQAQFNLNQTLFNLKTQGYQNSLDIAKDTLEPLLQIGGLLNPIGNFIGNVYGRKNFNQSTFNGTWQSQNHNYNYNYKR